MLKFRLSWPVCIAIAIFLHFGDIAGAFSLWFSKIPQSDVASAYVEKSTQLVDSLHAKWRNGIFEPLGDEFTLEMQENLSPELQKQSFEQILTNFGDYQGMTFVEALTAGFLILEGPCTVLKEFTR